MRDLVAEVGWEVQQEADHPLVAEVALRRGSFSPGSCFCSAILTTLRKSWMILLQAMEMNCRAEADHRSVYYYLS